MGLFNYVKVEQELPLDATLKTLNRNWRDEEFQTKELEENAMSTFILRDNKLFELKVEGHWEDNPDHIMGNGRFREFFDKNKWVKDSEEEVFRSDYTGTFTFGCVVYGDNIDGLDFYPDWKAVIVKGEVKEITILPEYQKYPSKDRIEYQIQSEVAMAKHERKMRCPVYRIYFNYYVRSVERISWKIQRSITKLIRGLEWMNWKGIRFIVKVLTPR